MNFNLSPQTIDQISSLVRTALKIGGGAAICAGQVDPSLGHAVAGLVTAAGGVASSVGLIWSYFAHKN